jgi:hypothetical protein
VECRLVVECRLAAIRSGGVGPATVKGGKSEIFKKVILKLFCDGFLLFFLQKSWYQKFFFLFQDLTDRFKGWK